MATVDIYPPGSVTITRDDGSNGGAGSDTRNPGLLAQGATSNAFDNEGIDLRFTFAPGTPTAVSFESADGWPADLPQSLSGDTVPDGRLTAAVTIAGTARAPGPAGTTPGQDPVHVESGYALLLRDPATGIDYKLAALSITSGDTASIAGFAFVGAAPPPGVALIFRTGTGSYLDGPGAAVPVGEEAVCFVRGTLIETAEGRRPVEELEVGDLVLTLDSGVQPVRWIGRQTLHADSRSRPIRIRAGAIGNDRDLRVSPNHRVLVTDELADLYFAEPEVLVAAKYLVDGASVVEEEAGTVEYFHLLFDRHQIIFAEGAPVESLHPGEVAMSALDREARDEVLELFPDLAGARTLLARRALTRREAAVLRRGLGTAA